MFRRERDRFDRFTERARKVLSLAQEESQRFQHNYIGTEHLLLGLVREDEGVAAKVLQALGVNVNAARSAVEEMVGRGDRIVLGEISLTPHAKKVIELAVVEAQLLKHHYVGTEHMLLGLLRVPEGRGVQILRKLGVEESAVRTQTLQLLSQQPPQPERIDEARQARGGFIGRRERGRFDRLGDDAWRVLALAQEEAQHFQHNYIGTEHLLLGLVRSEESTAGQVLRRLGLELQKVRNSVEFIIGHGDSIVLSEIGLTPRSKKVIELAVDEARLLQHNYVGSEHLLLGLIREGQGIAAGVLESLGVKLERVRMTVLEVLGKGQGLLDLAGAYVRGEKALEPLFSGVQDADDLVPEPASVEEHGNRFTIRARRVLVRACAEAQQYQQERVGTHHLLLALMREQHGLAFHLLRNLGIDSERILAATQFLTLEEKLDEPGDENGLTTDGKKAIELALDEAWQLTQPVIGSEHLLLGLLRSEGIGSGVLLTRGLKLDKARAEIRRLTGM